MPWFDFGDLALTYQSISIEFENVAHESQNLLKQLHQREDHASWLVQATTLESEKGAEIEELRVHLEKFLDIIDSNDTPLSTGASKPAAVCKKAQENKLFVYVMPFAQDELQTCIDNLSADAAMPH
jgi:hypothetical protein